MSFQPNTEMRPPPIQLRTVDPALLAWLQQLWNLTWQIWFPNYSSRMTAVEAYEIATEEGIQGGGLLSDDLTLKLDINGLAADATPDSATDYVATYDSSAGLHKKVLISDIVGTIPTSSFARTFMMMGA